MRDGTALASSETAAFRRALLAWYDKNRRDLPWRKTRDPYRIWISEIMLQQTRVAAVLEHYRLFLELFPNVTTLAAASESAVLAAWSGLGYYRRARLMRQCAQKIVAEHKGQFPKTAELLQTFPGIGRYTAAAIASIAFAEPIAVVDGNVERVLQRLTGRNLTAKEMWQQAQFHISPNRPADFNQSMMELGALVCTPRQPKCAACPVREYCATQGEAPRTASPQSQSRKEIWYTLDHRDARVRLVQRSATSSLMASMWELPQAAPFRIAAKANPEPAAKRRKIAAHGASRESAPSEMRAPEGRKNGHDGWQTFRHSITTTAYTVHVIRTAARGNKGKWIETAKLSHVPLTGLTRKILKAAGIIE